MFRLTRISAHMYTTTSSAKHNYFIGLSTGKQLPQLSINHPEESDTSGNPEVISSVKSEMCPSGVWLIDRVKCCSCLTPRSQWDADQLWHDGQIMASPHVNQTKCSLFCLKPLKEALPSLLTWFNKSIGLREKNKIYIQKRHTDGQHETAQLYVLKITQPEHNSTTLLQWNKSNNVIIASILLHYCLKVDIMLFWLGANILGPAC